ncbi:hypothetical protein C2S53_001325 [Perilla frutescens var. hirtella]|uniref:Cytochrome P450 n=1 Tax=Perilla frutescens var. hirtella TaxID=608512 RepID=A0AAD4IY22_PERFH|nr:hypothetical protein C2S53_001325 [Perilla frutescens var. hirtella]
MAIIGYPELFFFTLITILLYVWTTQRRKTRSLVTNWPVVGMLPGLLYNCHRIHDYITEILAQSGGTFEWRGPSFCNMDMLITSDPANIHHILSKNFSNYPKGPEFNKIFEILGDGIFNADFELWEFHRRTTLSILTHAEFYSLLERAVSQTIETGLLPVLDYFCREGIDTDLQDIFQRLTFDSICRLVFDYDPRSLCVEMPHIRCEKAFNDAIEALLHRHILPESVWKLQKWAGIGKEKKLKEAWKAFDEFIYPCLEKAEELENGDDDNGFSFKLISSFRKAYKETNINASLEMQMLRDTALSLMFAGRDTTSTCLTWLFWLISQNPKSERKIREEMEAQLLVKGDSKWRFFNVEESRKLVYLHGALCESLRLFPPLALEYKAPIRGDNLPSGNYMRENGKVIVSFYSVGRMKRVWGEDCLEFKPERWISRKGGVKHEASYKFPAFNAGPRTCLGKEMAFIQMKMVAAAIIHHYNIKLVEGQTVSPRDSVILQTKTGLRVTLSKTNAPTL